MTALCDARRDAFDKGACDNGPDEYGSYPCDPQVLLGGTLAECQVCGRVAAWGETKGDADGTHEA